MATTKKTTIKSKTKKVSAPKKATKASVKKAPKQQTVRSFRVSKPVEPFMTFTVTKQTLYWLVLSLVVLVFGLWLLKLQSDIQAIYDSIDATNMEQVDMLPKKKN